MLEQIASWRRLVPWARNPRAAAELFRNRRRTQAVLATAPFPYATYSSFLRRLSSSGAQFVRFDCKTRHKAPAVVVRHDIDTSRCVDRSLDLLAIDIELGIPSSVFLRADHAEYDLIDPRVVSLI